MAQLNGAASLLRTLREAHETMPCVRLDVSLVVPGSAKIDRELCERAPEGIATWTHLAGCILMSPPLPCMAGASARSRT